MERAPRTLWTFPGSCEEPSRASVQLGPFPRPAPGTPPTPGRGITSTSRSSLGTTCCQKISGQSLASFCGSQMPSSSTRHAFSEVVVAGPEPLVSLGQRWDIAFEFAHLSIRLVHARRIGAAYVSTRPFMIEGVFRAAHGGVRCEGGSVVVSLFPPVLFFSHITTDRSRSDREDIQIRQNVRPGGGDVDKTR